VTTLFDNSTETKYNPDPTRAVRWGEPTYDEMLAAFIDYSVKLEANSDALGQNNACSCGTSPVAAQSVVNAPQSQGPGDSGDAVH
jgi:hypothetical protein